MRGSENKDLALFDPLTRALSRGERGFCATASLSERVAARVAEACLMTWGQRLGIQSASVVPFKTPRSFCLARKTRVMTAPRLRFSISPISAVL